jgi:hypothetical protein
MSWDKHHDYRMRDLQVLGPMVAGIIKDDAKELTKIRRENEELRKENEWLRSQVVASIMRSFVFGWVAGLLTAVFVCSLVNFLC